MGTGEPTHQKQDMHKNWLHRYTQRLGLPIPVYEARNEAAPHCPKFRASVTVDGLIFTSPQTFSHLREAEQSVAMLALESICRQIQSEAVPAIEQGSVMCKSILHEYCARMGYLCQYTTSSYRVDDSLGPGPPFLSTVSLNGGTHSGRPAHCKRSAEQSAACTAIKSILENSESKNVMCEIIKSKKNLLSPLNPTTTGQITDTSLVIGPVPPAQPIGPVGPVELAQQPVLSESSHTQIAGAKQGETDFVGPGPQNKASGLVVGPTISKSAKKRARKRQLSNDALADPSKLARVEV